MKKALIFAAVVLSAVAASAQDYKFIYYLDQNFTSVEPQAALFIGKGYNDNGLFAVDGFDKNTNAIILKAHFADSSLSDLEGSFQTFYQNGKIKSEGNYKNSLEDGIWINRDYLGRPTDSLIFAGGVETGKGHFNYYDNSIRHHSFFYDSTRHKGIEIFYAANGLKEEEIRNEGDSLVEYKYQNGVLSSTETLRSEEKGAEFPGGDAAFHHFLERNMKSDIAASNNAPPGTYTAIVKFLVNKDGTISDILPETHMGYGIEEEVMRVLKLSPPWIPAILKGAYVRAYRRQPVTIVVAGD